MGPLAATSTVPVVGCGSGDTVTARWLRWGPRRASLPQPRARVHISLQSKLNSYIVILQIRGLLYHNFKALKLVLSFSCLLKT